MGKRVMVIAAHPDDELLGCGGTIARHAEEGDEVCSVIVCEGESLRYVGLNVNQVAATERAAQILGVSQVHTLKFLDQKLDTYCLVDVIIAIEKVVDTFKPQIVYTHHSGDLNKDHRIVFEAASVALRPLSKHLEEMYSFYIVGSTELAYSPKFEPDTWVNISKTLQKKLNAFACYESEVRKYPHPRSLGGLENLARYVGNQCYMEAAEMFETVRRVKR
ncbi:PIG-L deacetylase family protein [Desulforamulus aeronauticus]|uniref:N-acetylglucosaminyl deacetylase, LmbE family n=1 Tax=Desulforamulus aeronauticus DSM 10349 TaxID=1121421 RepID=A0A1M6V4E9_9FIRM|nr:PIG-L family deacetylase [Desulforamulus aeronauticus]SHK76372.1 N-acetylglucosaminyl deacetylase, LmbE family [Desulforamulus aeronauticus DSM 10349]